MGGKGGGGQKADLSRKDSNINQLAICSLIQRFLLHQKYNN